MWKCPLLISLSDSWTEDPLKSYAILVCFWDASSDGLLILMFIESSKSWLPGDPERTTLFLCWYCLLALRVLLRDPLPFATPKSGFIMETFFPACALLKENHLTTSLKSASISSPAVFPSSGRISKSASSSSRSKTSSTLSRFLWFDKFDYCTHSTQPFSWTWFKPEPGQFYYSYSLPLNTLSWPGLFLSAMNFFYWFEVM